MKSRFLNAVDLLEEKDSTSNDKLSARIQAERTKADNVKARYRLLGKGTTEVDNDDLGGLLDALRKDVAHLAVTPASDKAFALWQDLTAQGKTKDPYYVFLGKGAEARARGWTMSRLMEAGASEEDVFFIHEELVAQYRSQVQRYNRLVELLQTK